MANKEYILSARHLPAREPIEGPMDFEFYSLKLTDRSEGGKQYGVWWKPTADPDAVNKDIRAMIDAVVTEFNGESE